jgi:hypothetical protein
MFKNEHTFCSLIQHVRKRATFAQLAWRSGLETTGTMTQMLVLQDGSGHAFHFCCWASLEMVLEYSIMKSS